MNPWLLPIHLFYSPLFFTGLLRKDFSVLQKMLKVIRMVCSESFEVIMNMVVDRNLKSCELLANAILSNTNHPI